MQQARAAALLATPDATEPGALAAIAILRARGDLDSRAIRPRLTDFADYLRELEGVLEPALVAAD